MAWRDTVERWLSIEKGVNEVTHRDRAARPPAYTGYGSIDL
jgi:hypothetical protein